MKFLFTGILLLLNSVLNAQIRVVSYNLRYNNPRDSANAWPARLPSLSRQLNDFTFDFLGTQEGLHSQLLDLQTALGPNYRWVGKGRDAGDTRGEFSAIFFNQTRFELVHDTAMTLWLSPQPTIPSKGWDAALPRIVTFGKFREKKTGKPVWVFNTHFDHMGDTARIESAAIILQLIQHYAATESCILTGDFNATPTSKPIVMLSAQLSNAYNGQKPAEIPSPKGTFNGFSKTNEFPGPTIDFIFYRHSLNAKHVQVDYSTRAPGLYFSDHYPVIVDFEWMPK